MQNSNVEHVHYHHCHIILYHTHSDKNESRGHVQNHYIILSKYPYHFLGLERLILHFEIVRAYIHLILVNHWPSFQMRLVYKYSHLYYLLPNETIPNPLVRFDLLDRFDPSDLYVPSVPFVRLAPFLRLIRLDLVDH